MITHSPTDYVLAIVVDVKTVSGKSLCRENRPFFENALVIIAIPKWVVSYVYTCIVLVLFNRFERNK